MGSLFAYPKRLQRPKDEENIAIARWHTAAAATSLLAIEAQRPDISTTFADGIARPTIGRK